MKLFLYYNLKILKQYFKMCIISQSRLHIIGDSHSEVFNYINKQKQYKEKLYPFIVEGATVQGMTNPNSKTNALKYFKRYLQFNVRKYDYIGIMLGEVDCGFVIWYRMEQYSLSIEEQLENTLKMYEEFINYLIEKGFRNIILFSVPLPTIADDEAVGIVANLRNSISATQVERTKLTLKFNKLLKKLAKKYKLNMIDYSNDLLGENCIIQDKYLNKNKFDHHLDNKSFSKVILKYLDKYKGIK